MHVGSPRSADNRGRTRLVDRETWIRSLIEAVLFTAPGERVNRPDFGCGIRSLLFRPNSDALAAATQTLVKGALQKWLELEIQVERVAVAAEDSQLRIEVVYVRRSDGLRVTDRFEETT